ncbi:hypothetical protein M0R88_14075 [Halorussus gelatinilyticus]|uniref:Uncharacterized protein n=1 Tax=Halorussus gelatinilyticus TaxID=2937524 RepID=A0A8U0IFG9_9EURY|nr:hypothetical protein [Halorussus gelatinilyticus]UPV99637.1 hypothetical protein M0R88_14075 [Halorussus gelatinilyticus]
MTSVRLLAMLSTVLLVVGALLVGEALHGGVVTGEFAVTSPYVVLRIILGGIFIALGYRLRSPVEEYVDMPSGEPNRSGRDDEQSPDPDQSGEFDPEMSPLGGGGLDHVDADEREERDGRDGHDGPNEPDERGRDHRNGGDDGSGRE